jgi:arylsulfatase A-like enzyme
VSTLDLVPTLLDYAGAQAPEHLVGTSLRPAIEGSARRNGELLVGAGRLQPNRLHQQQPWGFYVRTPEWHFIESFDGSVELYDKGDDPDEERSVAAEHPELVDRFRAEVDAWKERTARPIASDAAGR